MSTAESSDDNQALTPKQLAKIEAMLAEERRQIEERARANEGQRFRRHFVLSAASRAVVDAFWRLWDKVN